MRGNRTRLRDSGWEDGLITFRQKVTGTLYSNGIKSSLQKPHQLLSDLIQSTAIGFFFLVQNLRYFRSEFEMGLRILLKL